MSFGPRADWREIAWGNAGATETSRQHGTMGAAASGYAFLFRCLSVRSGARVVRREAKGRLRAEAFAHRSNARIVTTPAACGSRTTGRTLAAKASAAAWPAAAPRACASARLVGLAPRTAEWPRQSPIQGRRRRSRQGRSGGAYLPVHQAVLAFIPPKKHERSHKRHRDELEAKG